MKTIVITNNKGGTGKTTVATQLAYSLMLAGYSAVAVDLDSQCNLTTALPAQRVVGNALDLVQAGNPSEFTAAPGELVLIEGHADMPAIRDDAVLRNTAGVLRALKGADFCIIDTPPTYSATVYGAMLAADYILAPIELKRFSVDGIKTVLKALVEVREINPDVKFLGLLPSRFDAVKEMERESLRVMAAEFPQLIIPHAIRNRTAYEKAEAEGMPVSEVSTRSGREAAAEFQAFFEWFLENVEAGT